MDTSPTAISLNELTQRGQQIYLSELREKLEQTHMGDWVIIEVESKKHFINGDEIKAIKKAKEEFPNKLFFIVKVGTLYPTYAQLTNEKPGWIL